MSQNADRSAAPLTKERLRQEILAREHVGAAGWAQMGVLDSIVRAGREQLAATEGLRQMVQHTLTQIRALPLSDAGGRQGHAESLEGLLASGQAQLAAAERLDAQISAALAEVSGLDLREVNVLGLERIHARVRELISSLGTIIEAARVQADSLEQVRVLDDLSATHHARLEAIARVSADAELESLKALGSEAAARIVDVEHAPGPQQMAALGEIGQAAAEHIAQVDAPAQERAEALRELADRASREAEAVQESASERHGQS